MPDITCGVGTEMRSGACVSLIEGGSVCGPGTILQAGVCVALSEAGVQCGPGTTIRGGSCVPVADGGPACGPGTTLKNGQCVADSDGGPRCGPGTVLEGGECIAVTDAGADSGRAFYDVRIGATTVPGDGYSRIPVLAIARDASGSPLTTNVILGLSRLGAGTVTPFQLPLGALGGTSGFTPCSTALSAGCAGKVRVVMALASDPAVIVAQSSEIDIVPPTGVGSTAACAVAPNAIFFSGDLGDWVHPGADTITDGVWTSAAISPPAAPDYAYLNFVPTTRSQGLWWSFWFSTEQLGLPMSTQVYDNAERAPFASPGHPGIDISGDGRGCNTITGRFQVDTLTVVGGQLMELLASFEQHCEGGFAALRGCVHYTR